MSAVATEPGPELLDPETRAFYAHAIGLLEESRVPFLVGGAYALKEYAGIERHTKDFDIFVVPEDCPRVLAAFAAAGHRTELTFPHWLGKVYHHDAFVDVIFSSGNGLARVDRDWFDHAVATDVFGRRVRLCPAEEMIWSKAYLMERERFDGADIIHILRARGDRLDWDRLLCRFGPDWRLLLCHLTMFGFVYPGERDRVPARVMNLLLGRLRDEVKAGNPADEHLCQGTLISRQQYFVDVEEWGYTDARTVRGTMTNQDIAHWTAAIDWEKHA